MEETAQESVNEAGTSEPQQHDGQPEEQQSAEQPQQHDGQPEEPSVEQPQQPSEQPEKVEITNPFGIPGIDYDAYVGAKVIMTVRHEITYGDILVSTLLAFLIIVYVMKWFYQLILGGKAK